MKKYLIVLLALISCNTRQQHGASKAIKLPPVITKYVNSNRVIPSINVMDFGATGDGVTDDYAALLAAAKACKDTSQLLLPKGVYYIAEYHTQNNGVANISFANLDDFSIIGDSAVISVNGNFRRTKDYQNGAKTNWYSYKNAVTPFLFNSCKHIYVSGIEINGNVNQMQRDSGVVESDAHLIKLNNCQDVTIENVNVHHAQTDGIYIVGDSSVNITMNNVRSANNARQGLSIINLQGGEFTNCSFINTGFTGGAYGYHMPGAGVDIEPRGAASNLNFYNCKLSNNRGGQLLLTAPYYSSNITLKGCIIDAGNSTTQYQMILNGKQILVDSCVIDCGSGNIRPVWSDAGSIVTIQNSTISSSSSAILSVSYAASDSVTIVNNTFNFTDDTLRTYFPYARGANLIFNNNSVFIPVKSTNTVFSLIENGLSAVGNKFYYNLKVSFKNTKQVSSNQFY